jgi:hypothetical protein
MPFPQFDPKDWEDIIAYRQQYDKWVSENKENLPAGLTCGNELAFTSTAMAISSLALLKTQNESEKLAIELSKSQKSLEYFTLLIFFLTVSLVLSLSFTIGSIATGMTVIAAGFLTVILLLFWKRQGIKK